MGVPERRTNPDNWEDEDMGLFPRAARWAGDEREDGTLTWVLRTWAELRAGEITGREGQGCSLVCKKPPRVGGEMQWETACLGF